MHTSARPSVNGRRRIRLVLALAAALSPAGCNDTSRPQPISEAATRYLDELVGIMRSNSINRLKIDWDAFRTDVLAAADGAQRVWDTYPAIYVALSLLGDGHSSFVTPTGQWISAPNRTCLVEEESTPPLPDAIGYVKVPTFGGSTAQATDFANRVQRTIAASDHDGLIGWIVDLRGNTGGNMWPMIAGVGPVLGEGVVGYFIDPTGAEVAWSYHDGASWYDTTVAQRVSAAYRLRREWPRVAVLTDNQVTSSGEATAIAFRGRPDTRSFGVRTCGLSTSNRGFVMSDGATLLLTTATLADRNRALYGDVVTPDEVVADPFPRAIAWLESASQRARARPIRVR
jgi:hypothetical protein